MTKEVKKRKQRKLIQDANLSTIAKEIKNDPDAVLAIENVFHRRIAAEIFVLEKSIMKDSIKVRYGNGREKYL